MIIIFKCIELLGSIGTLIGGMGGAIVGGLIGAIGKGKHRREARDARKKARKERRANISQYNTANTRYHNKEALDQRISMNQPNYMSTRSINSLI